MSAHTPGPWSIATDGRTIEAFDGEPVAGLVVSRMKPANARLIAAAPDLLDACQKAVIQFYSDYHSNMSEAEFDGDWIVRLLRAAIAKAEGR